MEVSSSTSSSNLKTQIAWFVIWLIAVFTFDLLLSESLNSLLQQAKSGQLAQMAQALYKQKPDILILGSSRANSHYDPRVFEKFTGLETFNAGMGGQGYGYTEILVKSSIPRSKPKLIILDLSFNLITDVDESDKTKILLPFAYKDNNVRSVLKRNDPYLTYRTILSTYYFNSSIYYLIDGIFVLKSRDPSLKGFAPLANNGIQSGLEATKNILHFNRYSQREITGYENTLRFITENKIPLAVVISPLYEPFWREGDPNALMLINMAKKYGAVILDYSLDQRFRKKKELFKDRIHLYEEGAIKFTEILVIDLKSRGLL